MRADGAIVHRRFKGDIASYSAMHHRVARERGRPVGCEQCGLTDPDRKYEWANLTGDYGNPQDYRRLCVPCHRRLDMPPLSAPVLRVDNRTGTRGVQFHPELWPKKPFRVVVRRRHIGIFATLDEAIAARKSAERKEEQCG